MATTSTIAGIKVYDFEQNPWNGNRRELNTLIPDIKQALELENVAHLTNFDLHPSPVEPVQAIYYEKHDRELYEQAVLKVAFDEELERNWEHNYGRDFRQLRQVRDVEGRNLSRPDEQYFQNMKAARPKHKPEFKVPKYVSRTKHTKEIDDYPKLVKKETEECTVFKNIFAKYISAAKILEFTVSYYENTQIDDSIRERTVGPFLHLMDLRSAPNPEVEKEIESDLCGLQTINCFQDAIEACGIVTKLQMELSYINVRLRKSDDFLIKCVCKKFNMHELLFQQFMLKHSLGEGILATKDIPMVSYAERSSAARQALLTNAEDSISMTWPAFVQALNNMQELLVKQKSSSILAARNVAYSSSISTGPGKDLDAREQNLRAREAEMARLTVRMTANHEYKEETQRRSASASRDREDNKRKFYRDKSPSNDRSKSHAGSTPGRHTNWENPATAKPQQQPTFKQPRYQYHHRANSAVAVVNTQDVKVDFWGNAYTITEPGSGYVTYFCPPSESSEK